MRNYPSADKWKIGSITTAERTVYETPEDVAISLAHPSILTLSSGKIIATLSQRGPGVKHVHGVKGRHVRLSHWLQGLVLISNDKGETWHERKQYPFCDGVLFRDGARIYLLGHKGNLQIMCSTDGGEHWSKVSELSGTNEQGSRFWLGPGSAVTTEKYVFLTAMALVDGRHKGDLSSVLTPIVMRGKAGTDLLQKKNWSFSTKDLLFREWISAETMAQIGIPVYKLCHNHEGEKLARGRWANHPGWHMMTPVHITNHIHRWYDERPETIHLLAALSIHKSNMVSLLKVTQNEAKEITFVPQHTPSETEEKLLHLPGGHLPFGLIYDEESKLYWLASNQTLDSMTKIKDLAREHPGLPHEDRQRMALYYSRNLVDWIFAGIIAESENPQIAYHTPSLAISGSDMYVTCLKTTHQTHHITSSKRVILNYIQHFRELVY